MQYKKLFLLLVLFTVLALFGCSDDNCCSGDSCCDNDELDATATLQGTIFDATTGARLTGNDLLITLVKGDDYISPDLLRNATTETTFAGDYVFNDLPISFDHSTNDQVYRLVVTKNGYQQFETYITLPVWEPVYYNNNNTLLDYYQFVGNIMLYPLGGTAGDLSVVVTYDGERVASATVQLQQDIMNNLATTETATLFTTSSTNIFADGASETNATNVLPSLTATTDANGVATFEGSTLVLGGQYDIVVLPVVHEGIQLKKNDDFTNRRVGTSDVVQYIAMEDAVPGSNPEGLYITSVTPSDPDTVNTTFTGIIITFNRAVVLTSDTTATVAQTSGNGVLTSSNAAMTLSSDGLTLTIAAPTWTVASTLHPTRIQYSGAYVSLAGETDVSYSVFGELSYGLYGSSDTLSFLGLDVVTLIGL